MFWDNYRWTASIYYHVINVEEMRNLTRLFILYDMLCLSLMTSQSRPVWRTPLPNIMGLHISGDGVGAIQEVCLMGIYWSYILLLEFFIIHFVQCLLLKYRRPPLFSLNRIPQKSQLYPFGQKCCPKSSLSQIKNFYCRYRPKAEWVSPTCSFLSSLRFYCFSVFNRNNKLEFSS